MSLLASGMSRIVRFGRVSTFWFELVTLSGSRGYPDASVNESVQPATY